MNQDKTPLIDTTQEATNADYGTRKLQRHFYSMGAAEKPVLSANSDKIYFNDSNPTTSVNTETREQGDFQGQRIFVKKRTRKRRSQKNRPDRLSASLPGRPASDNELDYIGTGIEFLNYFPEDRVFEELIHNCELAINMGIYPLLISQGSSGSYFLLSPEKEKIGVFKPKDEEPYGQQNPKWAKWFQKSLCPCCFGRGCIVPNQGYLSEAGASLIDETLGLGIVPKTKVVQLACETFNYSRVIRTKSRTKRRLNQHFPQIGRHFHRIGLPPKVGSCQTFVHGFINANEWIQLNQAETMPKETYSELIFNFQKLVVLDYITRNTDRGNDNWLIKSERAEVCNSACVETDTEEWDVVGVPHIKIAAIDNGLAFPFKHPDEWRSYPFQWSALTYAGEPFSDQIADLILDKLSDWQFVETNLVGGLRRIFKTNKDFKASIFDKQMSVMRGQIFNLVDSVRSRETAQQLVQRPSVYLEPALPEEAGLAAGTVSVSSEDVSFASKPFFKRW